MELVADQHRARVPDVDDPVGQVDRRPEVVALTQENGPHRQPDPHVGEELVIGVGVGEIESDAGGVGDALDHEHDLVADHLDHPAPEPGHDVMGELLEASYDGGQLGVAQMLTQQGEAHHVGEADGQHGALPGGGAPAAQTSWPA